MPVPRGGGGGGGVGGSSVGAFFFLDVCGYSLADTALRCVSGNSKGEGSIYALLNCY